MNHLTKRVGKYLVGRTIGEGTYAKVKYAQHSETGEAVALKILDKEHLVRTRMVEQVKKEITILKQLHHPHVVDLKEVMSSRDKIFMAMELVTGGDLFDKIATEGPMKEPAARVIFAQLLSALSYCHAHGVHHRDLKPENVLLSSSGDVKLSDFGLGSIRQEDTARSTGLLRTICGTPNYAAPEILAREGYDGAAADIWSLGVVLYVVLCGCLPFDEDNLPDLFRKISSADYEIPPWLSQNATSLIGMMIQADPTKRATLEKIWNHPWMDSIPRKKSSGVYLLPQDAVSSSVAEYFSHDHNEDILGANITKELSIVPSSASLDGKVPQRLNAFELINDYLDLSAIFEAEDDVVVRRTRFTSLAEVPRLLGAIEAAVIAVGGKIEKRTGATMRVYIPNRKGPIRVNAKIKEFLPGRRMVDLSKVSGNTEEFYKWYAELAFALECCPGNAFPRRIGEHAESKSFPSSVIHSPPADSKQKTKERLNAFELIGQNLNIASMFSLDEVASIRQHVQFSTRCSPEVVLKALAHGTEALGGRVLPSTQNKLYVQDGKDSEMELSVRMLKLLPDVYVVQIVKEKGGTMFSLMKWYNQMTIKYLKHIIMKRKRSQTLHPQASNISSLVGTTSLTDSHVGTSSMSSSTNAHSRRSSPTARESHNDQQLLEALKAHPGISWREEEEESL